MQGTQAPQFSLPDQDGQTHSLSDYAGKKVLLYFYPKDATPGCTTEACSFRDHLNSLKYHGVVVLGVSKDSVESHKKFAEKHGLNFPLLSDESGQTCEEYNVWREKVNFGKKYWGIKRESFLIGEDGTIIKHYKTVKPNEHVQKVVADVEAMSEAA